MKISKKLEDMQERVTESLKTLEIELKLFRQHKEIELKNIISEFVRIQKKSNQKMKVQWQGFLSKCDINIESLNTTSNND